LEVVIRVRDEGNRSILAIIAKTCASAIRHRDNLSIAASTGMLRIAAWSFPICPAVLESLSGWQSTVAAKTARTSVRV
jgi:hypothetical protein